MKQCRQQDLFEKVQYQGHAVITMCFNLVCGDLAAAENEHPLSLKIAAALSE